VLWWAGVTVTSMNTVRWGRSGERMQDGRLIASEEARTRRQVPVRRTRVFQVAPALAGYRGGCDSTTKEMELSGR